MKRAILLAACLAAAVLVWAVLARGGRRPNIILVSVDTLRADRVGAGAAPFLDALAADGVRFETAIAQATWTIPSHASMLTSLHPGVHQARRETDRLGDRILTMAEILKANGYETAAFTDGGWMSPAFGFHQGFDLFDDETRGDEKDRRALRWMRGRRRPFFLFYHTYDVHFPYTHHPSPRDFSGEPALEEIAARIMSGRFDLSDEEFEKAVLAWCTTREFYRLFPPGKIAPLKKEMDRFFRERWPKMPSCAESIRYLVEAYDAGVRRFDRRFRGFWERARAAGLDADTILIVTSDHGEGFLEHGTIGHPEALYDEIIRVPLIVAFPGLPRAGKAVAAQAMLIDILPTALEMAGIAPPPHLQGESLVPLIRGVGKGATRPAFAGTGTIEAVRTPDWKLIRAAAEGGPPPELYHLARDPGERENLAGAEPARLEALAGELDRRRAADEALRERLGLGRETARPDEETLRQLRALGYLQ
ncbi:MAG: sulfatase [bacterium]|nr:sulfatase [bacterium]